MKFSLVTVWGFVPAAIAVLPFVPAPPPFRIEGSIDRLADNTGFFEQPVDHKRPELGSFQQRYWWNTTFWEGPGSPVRVYLAPQAVRLRD
jgi:hypothetical protein